MDFPNQYQSTEAKHLEVFFLLTQSHKICKPASGLSSNYSSFDVFFSNSIRFPFLDYIDLFPVEYSTLLLKLLLFIGLFLILKRTIGGSTPSPSMSGIPVHAPEAGGAIHRSGSIQPKGAMDTAEIDKIEPPGMRNAIKQTNVVPLLNYMDPRPMGSSVERIPIDRAYYPADKVLKLPYELAALELLPSFRPVSLEGTPSRDLAFYSLRRLTQIPD
ncbi:imidazolonepropionase [Striga asiatica]|uniref:Imidazolonepropionase n=1 Tax=Striga asiatica TaxID=4170 RepID=A0A5A7QRU7_STRAF|nr:imidazolonepropionase [Striga asiatica]